MNYRSYIRFKKFLKIFQRKRKNTRMRCSWSLGNKDLHKELYWIAAIFFIFAIAAMLPH